MIYNFISLLGKKNYLDQTIATCIYTGILTDSGSFRFPKTTVTTHRIIADLIDLGAENTTIPTLLFDNNSYERLQLLGRALQNMKVFPEFRTSYISLSQKELDHYNYVKGDTEGIVNYGLTIKGITFAVIFIEHSDEKIIKAGEYDKYVKPNFFTLFLDFTDENKDESEWYVNIIKNMTSTGLNPKSGITMSS
jgi:phosphoesterase RecJ-like protein